MSCVDEFDDTKRLLRRLEKLDEQIEACDEQLLTLNKTGVHQYSLDTGQSRESVMRQSVRQLTQHREWLESQRAAVVAKLRGTGAVFVAPGF